MANKKLVYLFKFPTITKLDPNDIIQFRVINTKTNNKVNLADYDDLWEYRYQLDIRKEGILKIKLKKLHKLLLKHTPQYIQLQVKHNNRFISYESWLEIKQ